MTKKGVKEQRKANPTGTGVTLVSHIKYFRLWYADHLKIHSTYSNSLTGVVYN